MDIREAPAAAFQAIEARESRADLLRLVGSILFGLAGVVLLVMLVNLFRQRRVRTTVDTWRSSSRSIAASVQRELSAIRQQSRGGWDSELAGRALAATRIAATLVSGRAIAQTRVRAATVPLDGQLMMKGWMGRVGIAGVRVADLAEHDRHRGRQQPRDVHAGALRPRSEARWRRAGRGARGGDCRSPAAPPPRIRG